jgi:hypothetical protein
MFNIFSYIIIKDKYNKDKYNKYNNIKMDDLYSFMNEMNEQLKFYIEKKKYLISCRAELQKKMVKIYVEMSSLYDKLNYINVTHSNTTNFIMANNNLLRIRLNSYIDIYNEYLTDINKINYFIRETELSIYECDETLKKYELKCYVF